MHKPSCKTPLHNAVRAHKQSKPVHLVIRRPHERACPTVLKDKPGLPIHRVNAIAYRETAALETGESGVELELGLRDLRVAVFGSWTVRLEDV